MFRADTGSSFDTLFTHMAIDRNVSTRSLLSYTVIEIDIC